MGICLEDAEQIALMQSLRLEVPELAAVLFHVANQRHCGPAQGAKLKRMGVKAGVSDLLLLVPRWRYHGMVLELKADGGTLSQVQKAFLKTCAAADYLAVTCWGWECAKEHLIKYWLGPIPRNVVPGEGPDVVAWSKKDNYTHKAMVFKP